MRKQYAVLQRLEYGRQITNETDYEFLHHLQSALLLALREQGSLSPMQHRHAQEQLGQQRRERAKRNQEEP